MTTPVDIPPLSRSWSPAPVGRVQTRLSAVGGRVSSEQPDLADKTPETSAGAPTVQNGYYRTLPLLIFGLFFYALVWMITGRVAPASLANWLWTDSYLLFQLLLAAGNFFVFTYLCQSAAWGRWAALMGASVMFFKLGHFLLTLPLIISLSLLAIIYGYLLVFRHKKSDKPTKTTS
ncbi:hypothetical protein IJJ08_04740 [bacterium]|nr:hypothetical protein [bacterium]